MQGSRHQGGQEALGHKQSGQPTPNSQGCGPRPGGSRNVKTEPSLIYTLSLQLAVWSPKWFADAFTQLVLPQVPDCFSMPAGAPAAPHSRALSGLPAWPRCSWYHFLPRKLIHSLFLTQIKHISSAKPSPVNPGRISS